MGIHEKDFGVWFYRAVHRSSDISGLQISLEEKFVLSFSRKCSTFIFWRELHSGYLVKDHQGRIGGRGHTLKMSAVVPWQGKAGRERRIYMFSYVKKKQEKHTDITLWDEKLEDLYMTWDRRPGDHHVLGYHTVHVNTLETKNLNLQAAPPCKGYWILDLILDTWILLALIIIPFW